jgi:hypothetical protein
VEFRNSCVSGGHDAQLTHTDKQAYSLNRLQSKDSKNNGERKIEKHREQQQEEQQKWRAITTKTTTRKSTA